MIRSGSAFCLRTVSTEATDRVQPCPHCGQRNRVRPGTVRCGRCGNTFTVNAEATPGDVTSHTQPSGDAPGKADTDKYDALARRIHSLEARVAALEAQVTTAHVPGGEPRNQDAARPLISVRVMNKRYDHAVQPHIWFDCIFTAVGLSRPARAVKGQLEFCDLFGAPIFTTAFTLNDRLEPGESLTKPSIGFVYNQFMTEHQWVLGTDLDNMTFRFRVDQILYEDGAE